MITSIVETAGASKSAAELRTGARGLSAGNFRKVAVNGFGDPHNSYAWGCCYFRDHIYIGTARDMLVMVAQRFPYDLPMPIWPVELPNSDWDADLRGQVWRYSPASEHWERVFLSPMVEGVGGRTVPLAHGFRNMTVFQGTHDEEPVIYCIPGCGSYGKGPVLLRCADGVNFEQASDPGIGLDDTNVTSFRGLVPFKGQLFTTPAGSRNSQGNVSYNGTIICNPDPARAAWTASNEPAFGDETNQTIFDLGVCGDFLYAGTINIRHGFELWKSRAEGPAPHKWMKVLTGGAGRGQHNQLIMCFAEFRGAMYFGTGIQNGGHDRQYNVGRAAGEIIRVWPDDSWDLVMGEPRITDDGVKFPVSGYGLGFDNFFNGYIWRLVVHDDVLYVGTFNAASFLRYSSRESWPNWLERMFDDTSLEKFLESRGGAELWRTSDGDNWVPVTRNGLGNIFNYGIRSLLSTPHGLFVGTANPYGPKIAVSGPGGWRYKDNPQGGVEVWQGTLEHQGGVQLQGGTAGGDGRTQWMTADGSTPENAAALLPQTCTLALYEDESREDELLGRQELVDLSFLNDETPGIVTHEVATDSEAFLESSYDATLRLGSSKKDLHGTLPTIAEEIDEFLGPASPQFVGYWGRHRTATPERACYDLLDEFVALITAHCNGNRHALLTQGRSAIHVAEYMICGKHFDEATALADRSISQAEAIAVRVISNKRGRSALKKEQFDCVIWIEGPTAECRAKELKQAADRLTPGGLLLASDLIGQSVPGERQNEPGVQEAYESDFEHAGLQLLNLTDITSTGWVPFFDFSRKYFSTKLLLRQIDMDHYQEIIRQLPGGEGPVEKHLFLLARKKSGAKAT